MIVSKQFLKSIESSLSAWKYIAFHDTPSYHLHQTYIVTCTVKLGLTSWGEIQERTVNRGLLQ